MGKKDEKRVVDTVEGHKDNDTPTVEAKDVIKNTGDDDE